MPATVWTQRRKWLGNLIPAAIWVPLTGFGIFWMAHTNSVLGPGLVSIIAATVLGWLAVNQFGLFENKKMRRQLQRIVETQGDVCKDAIFVGIATPKFSSALDPHEEVGFLRILPDRISFQSETRRLEMPKEEVVKVRFRPNVHTAIGLGRWISVEGKSAVGPVRLLIEPRERGTLLGNLILSKELLRRIRRWAQS